MKKAYTVAVGNIPVFPNVAKKETKEALKIIKELEGLIGVYAHYPNGTLLLFTERKYAVFAKNLLKSKGILTGINIGEAVYEDN